MTSQPTRSRLDEARASLVENQLRPEGVIDAAVLAAMGAVARERFVPDSATAVAYSDRAIPLGNGRALMPAASLAQLLQALEARPGQRVLVVGAGTGYSSALLAHMGLAVTGVESEPAFSAVARANGVELNEGPLNRGFEGGSPFDLILIDGAVEEEVPHTIVSQLRDGGRLATGLVDRGVGRLAAGTRVGSAFGLRPFADAAVSILPGFERARSFVF